PHTHFTSSPPRRSSDLTYTIGRTSVAGVRRAATRITAGDGTDLTGVLDGSGSYPITPSDVLTVDLGSGAGSAPVVVRVDGTGALQLQVPDGHGGWRAASQSTPRTDPDELVFAAPVS